MGAAGGLGGDGEIISERGGRGVRPRLREKRKLSSDGGCRDRLHHHPLCFSKPPGIEGAPGRETICVRDAKILARGDNHPFSGSTT